MKLRLHKTTIRFKVYFDNKSLDTDTFPEFCKKLEQFPINKAHPTVKGLNLKGEHYFRRASFSDMANVGTEEIKAIKSITPIIDHGVFPFILKLDYFRVNIPTAGNSFDDLMDAIQTYEVWLDKLFEKNFGKIIEIHLRGGLGESISHKIFKKTIPEFVEGEYEYQTMIEKQGEKGEILLPAKFRELPDEIKGLLRIIHGRYSLKLILDEKKFILKPVKKKELGISLFSDQSSWFQKTLRRFQQANVFDTVVDTKYSDSIPSIT